MAQVVSAAAHLCGLQARRDLLQPGYSCLQHCDQADTALPRREPQTPGLSRASGARSAPDSCAGIAGGVIAMLQSRLGSMQASRDGRQRQRQRRRRQGQGSPHPPHAHACLDCRCYNCSRANVSRASGEHADTKREVKESKSGGGHSGLRQCTQSQCGQSCNGLFASAATELQLQQDLQFGANHQCVASQVAGPGTQILQRHELVVSRPAPSK